MARRAVQPTYYDLSRSPQYSLIFAIPLLVVYEGLALFLNHSDLYGIRNTADVFLKLFLAYVGIHGFLGFGAAIIVALILFHILGGGWRGASIRYAILVWMLAESLIYSFLLGGVVSMLTQVFLAQPFPPSRSAQILVSLGAGIYEELMFRVLLLGALIFLLHRLLYVPQNSAYGMAAIIGALFFSAFHYVGPFGDPWQLPSFVFRFFAGLVLTGLYYSRGYGITAYTHSLYDLWITFGLI